MPPALDDRVNVTSSTPPSFVMEPPKRMGITGKISTLFRSKSRSPSPAVHVSRATAAESNTFDDSASVVSQQSKRIFYSSTNDDDSEDSYESRMSRASRASRGSTRSNRKSGVASTSTASPNADDEGFSASYHSGSMQGTTVTRFRGFSTSIKSLFLDEALVCAAIGCFGLILSNRTEFLLNLRNERRGVASKNTESRRMPSRILGRVLVGTIVLMFSTFLIWGFGNGQGAETNSLKSYDYNNQERNDDGIVQNNSWDDYLQNNNGNRYQGNYKNNYYGYKNDDNNIGDDYSNWSDDYRQNDRGYSNDDRDDDYYHWRNRLLSHTGAPGESSHRKHGLTGYLSLRRWYDAFWEPFAESMSDGVDAIEEQRRRTEDYDYNSRNPSTIATNSKKRNIASDVRIGLFISFIIFLGLVGRRRRMRTRFYLVRARAQEDHLYYASSDEAALRRVSLKNTREDQYEGACSHALCGCYPVDDVDEAMSDEQVEVTDAGIFRRKRGRHHEDIVARGFSCLLASCCGAVCKCWFQCLSICALAQEAREIRLLLPPRYQRVDYITHQPFHEYHKDVYNLRRGWMGHTERMSGIMPHYNALSRLSRYIVIVFFLILVAVGVTLVLNPRAAFSWQDMVILSATFMQSFLVLFIVHWIFHKSDLSLDAVIKFFAAGFLIAVPTAVFFEGLLVNITIFGGLIVYYAGALMTGDSFSKFVFEHWRAIWILGELFNAYVVAAITEELCKYYVFRAVEHPDLLFLTGLQREQQVDEDTYDGGLVKYPFASHQVQNIIYDQNQSQGKWKGRHSRSSPMLRDTATIDEEIMEDIKDVRTYRQKAMAITTGMISVAVGLSCAENCLYVFVLGGALGNSSAVSDDTRPNDVMEAWIVLFFRSIFPVHALAAAMQSINMVRKFVESSHENGHRIGVGRIVLPAIILHGTFDAILLGINVFVETAWDKYLAENEGNITEEDPYNAFIVNLSAWISITAVMLIGLLWYYLQNRSQRLRLIMLEETSKPPVPVAVDSTWTHTGNMKNPRLEFA